MEKMPRCRAAYWFSRTYALERHHVSEPITVCMAREVQTQAERFVSLLGFVGSRAGDTSAVRPSNQ